MNMGVSAEERYSSTSIIKLVTGAALTIDLSGESRLSAKGDTAVSTPRRLPAIIPRANPANTRSSVSPQLFQKTAVPQREKSAFAVVMGEGSKRSLPTAHAAACHTSSQNAAAMSFLTILFLKNAFTYLTKYISSPGTLPPTDLGSAEKSTSNMAEAVFFMFSPLMNTMLQRGIAALATGTAGSISASTII